MAPSAQIMTESLSSSALYARSLDKATKASNLPTIHDKTQELIQDALSDLVQLSSRVASLSLFSSNDTLDDISTPDLVYISLPFVRAEVQNRVRTIDRDDRMSILAQVQRHLNTYTSSLERYDIVPEAERLLCGQQTSSIRDAGRRREVKIRQYKAENDLRTRIEVIRRRRRQSAPVDHPSSNFDLVASLLPPPGGGVEDPENENILREASLLLLRLFYAQACAQLEGVDQEIQLLRNAPTPFLQVKPPADERPSKVKGQEDMWRIDAAHALLSRGPLLDSTGKPLQPFTILPTSMPDRARAQAHVFGPGHRLPTMTIDEYLEIERQRGGILPSRGPQPDTNLPLSEQLTVDSEMEGTVCGELKVEEKRLKDEQWVEYKEANPRGAGNAMNRG